MKPRNFTPFRSHASVTAAFSVALCVHFSTTSAFADNVWNGGYATTGAWQNPNNWGGTAWANAQDTVFGSININNNTATFLGGTGGKTVKSLTFQAGSPAYNVRLATAGSGGELSVLTFISTNTGLTVEAGNTSSHNIGQALGSIALEGNLLVTHNGAGTLTLSRPVTGAFGLTKSGSGLLVLSAANTYSGATTIDEGTLRGTVGGSSANSGVVLNAAPATFSVNVTDNIQSWTAADFTAAAAGTIQFNFGAVLPSTTVSPLVVTVGTSSGTGTADFNAATPSVTVVTNSALIPGTYPLMTWDFISGTAPDTDNLTLSQPLLAGTTADLSVSGNTLNLVIAGTAPQIVKADNTTALFDGSSWVSNVAPGAGDVAVWDSTVTGANTTVLGADLTWSGISIEDPTGPVTIDAGNTLTLGAAAVDIDMSAATADFTLNAPLTLVDANVWNVAASRSLTLAGQVSGAFGITKLGAGTAILSSPANNYTGNATITGGTLKLGASDVIPNTAGFGSVSVAGTLDLNGNSETINGLSGAGFIDNTSAATASFAVGTNGANSTFNGVIQNTVGTLDFTKTGTGTLTLGGANTLGGAVAVNGGTLAFSNIAPFANITGITMAGGTTLRPAVVNGAISAPITVGATGTNVTFNAPSIAGAGGTNPVPVTLGGAISGAGNVTFSGIETGNAYSMIILNSASNYSGSTLVTITNGTNTQMFVRLGAENALPATTVLTLDGGDGTNSDRYCQVDLRGNNQTLAGLTNVPRNSFRKQQIINNSATAATLTINNSEDFAFSGRLGTTTGQTGSVGANLGLLKSGVGTFTISGANNYTGATTITGGTLALGANNVLPTTAVFLGGGTLAVGAGFTDTVGTLALTSAATINLGDSASALVFADSSGETWTGPLNLTGSFVSGASLRFGDGTGTGLTPAQLASISGPGLSGIGIDGSGFITATVEASGYTTWAATNAGGQGPGLDFDNDGADNGVEFFLNAAAGFTALPTLDGSNTIAWTNGGNLPAAAYGTQFIVQTSGNLTDWNNIPVGELTSNTEGPGGTLSYTLTGVGPRFVRLLVLPD